MCIRDRDTAQLPVDNARRVESPLVGPAHVPVGSADNGHHGESGRYSSDDHSTRGRRGRKRARRATHPERRRSPTPHPQDGRQPGRQSSPQRLKVEQANVEAAILAKLTLLGLILAIGQMIRRGAVNVQLIRSKILETFSFVMPTRNRCYRPMRSYHVNNNPCNAEVNRIINITFYSD